LSRVFFTDRDLGKRFPHILAVAGLHVVRHHDQFRPDGSDEEWLEYVGSSGLVAITHDRRIRHKPNELYAVREHRVALLVVIGKASFADLADNFVRTIARIEAFLDANDPPVIAKIYRPSPSDLARSPTAPGSIVRWHPN
jgi:PIN like domain